MSTLVSRIAAAEDVDEDNAADDGDGKGADAAKAVGIEAEHLTS